MYYSSQDNSFDASQYRSNNHHYKQEPQIVHESASVEEPKIVSHSHKGRTRPAEIIISDHHQTIEFYNEPCFFSVAHDSLGSIGQKQIYDSDSSMPMLLHDPRQTNTPTIRGRNVKGFNTSTIQTSVGGGGTSVEKRKRRTKKERSKVSYPEGSTYNAKTLHLKPKKTQRFDQFDHTLRSSTQVTPSGNSSRTLF
jgi:hypothetical protein